MTSLDRPNIYPARPDVGHSSMFSVGNRQLLRRASVGALILLALVGALIQTGTVGLAAAVVRSAFDYITGGAVTGGIR